MRRSIPPKTRLEATLYYLGKYKNAILKTKYLHNRIWVSRLSSGYLVFCVQNPRQKPTLLDLGKSGYWDIVTIIRHIFFYLIQAMEATWATLRQLQRSLPTLSAPSSLKSVSPYGIVFSPNIWSFRLVKKNGSKFPKDSKQAQIIHCVLVIQEKNLSL